MTTIVKGSVGQIFSERVRTSARNIFFTTPQSDYLCEVFGVFDQKNFHINYEQAAHEAHLIALGVREFLGSQGPFSIATFGGTRPETLFLELAALSESSLLIPLPETKSPKTLSRWVEKSEAQILFIEKMDELEVLIEGLSHFPNSYSRIKHFVFLDPLCLRKVPDLKSGLTLFALRERGRRTLQNTNSKDEVFLRGLEARKSQDRFLVVFSQNEERSPRGAVFTQNAFVKAIESLLPFVLPKYQRVLNLLPFSNNLSRLVVYLSWALGIELRFESDPGRVFSTSNEFLPHMVFGCPKTLEKFLTRLKNSSKPWHLRLPLFLKTKNHYPKIVFNCLDALSRPVLDHFPIHNVYTLTESAGPITLQRSSAPQNSGTLGSPVPGVHLKFSDEGEILIRSEFLFRGYHASSDSEPSPFDPQGWFKTGDLGKTNPNGEVVLLSKKNQVQWLISGVPIFPLSIEKRILETVDLASRAYVVGHRKPFASALIVLNPEKSIRFASEREILFSQFSDLSQHTKIVDHIRSCIGLLNSTLESHEQIRGFVLIPDSPNLKTREEVVRQYLTKLDSMYTPGPEFGPP